MTGIGPHRPKALIAAGALGAFSLAGAAALEGCGRARPAEPVSTQCQWPHLKEGERMHVPTLPDALARLEAWGAAEAACGRRERGTVPEDLQREVERDYEALWQYADYSEWPLVCFRLPGRYPLIARYAKASFGRGWYSAGHYLDGEAHEFIVDDGAAVHRVTGLHRALHLLRQLAEAQVPPPLPPAPETLTWPAEAVVPPRNLPPPVSLVPPYTPHMVTAPAESLPKDPDDDF